MKLNILVAICIFLGCMTCLLRAQKSVYTLCKGNAADAEFIWELTTNQLSKIPRWFPDREEPPVALGKAVAIANKWLKTSKYNPLHDTGEVERIMVCAVEPRYGEYHNAFYYRIWLGFGTYGNSLECIVLMDGTILEPRVVPLASKN